MSKEHPIWILELRSDTGPCLATLHPPSSAQYRLGSCALAKTDQVTLGEEKPQTFTLEEVTKRLITRDKTWLEASFQEREQVGLGTYLWQQTLGKCPELAHKEGILLRILSDDEHLARLPWLLMAEKGIRLVSKGWWISMTDRLSQLPDAELPPSPKILVAAPEATRALTGGKEHLAKLREQLIAKDTRMALQNHYREAHRWEEFRDALCEFQPDVVYYLGHGEGDRDASRLSFQDGSKGIHWIPVAQVAEAFRPAPSVKLAYLNCCLGEAGGWLGVGHQLRQKIPAVISNRSLAATEVAKEQALAFFHRLLHEGESPEQALAHSAWNLNKEGFATDRPYWFAPTLHAHYGRWQAHPPKKLDREAHWVLRVDRTKQIGEVNELVRSLMESTVLKLQAVLWYGRKGEGVRIFHERLFTQLGERVDGAVFKAIRPAWPKVPNRYAKDFEEMLADQFEMDRLEERPVQARLRRWLGNKKGLLYIDHTFVEWPSEKAEPKEPRIRLARLQDYLAWLDDVFVPMLPSGVRVLVGLSYEIPEDKFLDEVEEKLEPGWAGRIRRTSTLNVLDQMKEVPRRDLARFLADHGLVVPSEQMRDLLDYLYHKTEGHYEATLPEIEKLLNGEFPVHEEEIERDEEDDEGEGPTSKKP